MSPRKLRKTLRQERNNYPYVYEFVEDMARHNAVADKVMAFIETANHDTELLNDNFYVDILAYGHSCAIATEGLPQERERRRDALPAEMASLIDFAQWCHLTPSQIAEFKNLVDEFASSFVKFYQLEFAVSGWHNESILLPPCEIPRSEKDASPATMEFFAARDAIQDQAVVIFYHLVNAWETSSGRGNYDDEDADTIRRDLHLVVRHFRKYAYAKDARLVLNARSDVYDVAEDYGMESDEDFWKLKLLLDLYEQSAVRVVDATEALEAEQNTGKNTEG